MRSSNISNRFELSLIVFAIGASACSSTPATPDGGSDAGACSVEATGNIYGESNVAACSSVATSADAGGDWILTIDTSTSDLARLVTTIDLGSSPVPGQLTNETVTSWDATALAASTSCAFLAGTDAVPSGSFTLQLGAFDAPTSTAHGTLQIDAYLHAPPTIDCSYGDIETITVQF
jgi:hypothetical protein